MLRQRVITALVLLAVMLAALAAEGPMPFAWLSLGFMAAAGWEWARLNQAGSVAAVLQALALVLCGLLTLSSPWRDDLPLALWGAIVLLWAVSALWVLRRGPANWADVPRGLRWALGLIALWAAWLALIHARGLGINFLLSMLCVVWMADIAAYFGGRAWGRRKLAPAISPGKSWEGVWSGLVGVLVLAAVWIAVDARFPFDGASLFTRVHQAYGSLVLVLALLVLAGLSVVGDLIESLVKRACGAKDSSRLLPGHGGVLDRVDALLPVMPAALALVGLSGG